MVRGTQPKRVVVTGLGAVTPIGLNVETFWQGLLAGRSGVGPITLFDASAFPVQIAAEVKDFDADAHIPDRKEARRMARFTQFAVAAAREALKNAQLDITPANCHVIGINIGSGMGALGVIEEQVAVLRDRGPQRVNPFTVPLLIPNMASGQVAISTGARGINLCTVTACASGTHAIGEAYQAILDGRADAMLAGGAEAVITPLGIAAFASARALSTYQGHPTKASRPFAKDRDGFVMGEGAGVLVLECLARARARHAPILAEIVGYGATGDAYHMTQPPPDADGCQRAMRLGLTQASIEPSQVDYINAHGTGTMLNDHSETLAIKQVFGDHAARLAVSSIKSMIGHLIGAAGAVEAIATILCLRDQIIPPTINLDEPDPLCDLDYIPHHARAGSIQFALSNSMGFGGHNASLIFRRYDPSSET